jgi:hydrogenase maturation protein HypF
MAEHALDGPVIGLSLDGTGYGTDGRIWGGEVLVCTLDAFQRFAHLDYVPMPGGDAAVREPWRMALGHLQAAGLDVTSERVLGLLGARTQEARLLVQMIDRKLNAPLTSSLGRLFDGAAAVVMGRRAVDYEAQAAIELEGLCVGEPDDAEPYEVTLKNGEERHTPMRLGLASLWSEMLADVEGGVGKARIAARFHASVAHGFVQAALAAKKASGIERVALSGGVMHNRRLNRLIRRELEAQGLRVYQHRRVSPGDGGLSYGQAAVAAAMLRKV